MAPNEAVRRLWLCFRQKFSCLVVRLTNPLKNLLCRYSRTRNRKSHDDAIERQAIVMGELSRIISCRRVMGQAQVIAAKRMLKWQRNKSRAKDGQERWAALFGSCLVALTCGLLTWGPKPQRTWRAMAPVFEGGGAKPPSCFLSSWTSIAKS